MPALRVEAANSHSLFMGNYGWVIVVDLDAGCEGGMMSFSARITLVVLLHFGGDRSNTNRSLRGGFCLQWA